MHSTTKLSLLLAAIGTSTAAWSLPNTPLAKDPHSYANINEVTMTDVYLNLAVDFEHKKLNGYVDLTLSPHTTKKLVLDSKGLKIAQAERWDNNQWVKTKFSLAKADETLGQALKLDILPTTSKVRITYETTDASDGLNWATPEQTFGKQKPMLYSLSQSIYGRTWFPQQDTPAVRVTYSADIATPADMVAKMSADNTPNAVASAKHHFEMKQPVVPYLIALAVGDFDFRPLGTRAGVYAEPSMADKAANEFVDAEKMMGIVEDLYGPYQWGRNDMMVMPPSFPFGGMEHARLTFLTPTVITGDRELVSLNAHELAHSWSGNLVTNRYWRDLWINEGFTTYVEKRVIEKLYGQKWSNLEQTIQHRGLLNELKDLAKPSQILAIDLKGQHPDNVFSEIPYAKGSLFLTTLEHAYGRETFDDFVRQYFKDFAWKTITTEEFETYLYRNLVDKYPGKFSHAAIKEWIYQSGYPKAGFVPQSTELAAIDAQIVQLASGKLPAEQLITSDWTVNHWIYFLQELPTSTPKTTLAALDQKFGLSTSSNLIKEFNWLKFALKADYQPAIDARLRTFLKEQGRIKLTKPLYQEMVKTPKGIELAKSIFAETKSGLHAIVVWEIESNVFKKNKISF